MTNTTTTTTSLPIDDRLCGDSTYNRPEHSSEPFSFLVLAPPWYPLTVSELANFPIHPDMVARCFYVTWSPGPLGVGLGYLLAATIVPGAP